MQPSIYNGFYRRNGCPLPPLYPSLHRGLVASYAPLLGRQGNRLFDWSGHNRHGTLTNMDAGTDWVPASVRSVSGYALDFDGINDCVNCGNQPVSLSHLGLHVTFRLANASRADFDTLIAKRSGVTTHFGLRKGKDAPLHPSGGLIGELTFYHNTGSFKIWHTSNANMQSNTWYTAILNYDGASDPQIILNGRVLTGAWGSGFAGPAAMTANATPVTLGCYGTGIEALQGSISVASIYDRKITIDESRTIAADPLALYRYQVPTYETVITPSFNAAWARRHTQLIGGGCL